MTQIGENYSSSTVVTPSMPRGFVLGPLLLILHINELANMLPIDSKTFFFYADDTAITHV